MKQDRIHFSKGGVIAAFTIVLTLVVVGFAATAFARRVAVATGVAVNLGCEGAPCPSQEQRPRIIGDLDQTLIETDDTTAHDRRTELDRLNHYGWVDQSHGVVHIPIQRAMEIVAQEGR